MFSEEDKKRIEITHNLPFCEICGNKGPNMLPITFKEDDGRLTPGKVCSKCMDGIIKGNIKSGEVSFKVREDESRLTD